MEVHSALQNAAFQAPILSFEVTNSFFQAHMASKGPSLTRIPEIRQKPNLEFWSFGRLHRNWNSVINSHAYQGGAIRTWVYGFVTIWVRLFPYLGAAWIRLFPYLGRNWVRFGPYLGAVWVQHFPYPGRSFLKAWRPSSYWAWVYLM